MMCCVVGFRLNMENGVDVLCGGKEKVVGFVLVQLYKSPYPRLFSFFFLLGGGGEVVNLCFNLGGW